MTEISFTLKRLDKPPALNASLAKRIAGEPAVYPRLAIAPRDPIQLASDFNGDGILDRFQLTIRDGLLPSIRCVSSSCSLLVPGGAAGVAQLIPADLTQDGIVDFYLETTAGAAFMLENTMDSPIQPMLDRDTYRTHLLGIAILTLGPKGFWDAVRKSIALTAGQSHTWVVPEPKPRYPWIDGGPLHTDCVIDLERILAELHNASGKFSGFQRHFNRIQFYDFKGRERTDFFTEEAIPHLVRLGMVQDLTPALWATTSRDPIPTFQATVNKENWYRGKNKGAPSGKAFPEWKVTLHHIPFDRMLVPHSDGHISLRPEIAAALPPVSIFVVVNKGRVFKAHGTEIPTSHVGYLMKDPQTGEITIHHSTPTTDLGVASATQETVTAFFQTRYRKVVDGKLSVLTYNKIVDGKPIPAIYNEEAVGVQLLGFLPPNRK